MVYLASILVSAGLLAGFLALVRYEAQHDTRFFADRRAKLDAWVERMQFVLSHVDFAAFIREEAIRLANTAGHTIATLSLQAVRAIERVLARVVRHFRAQHEHAPSKPKKESSRAFVKELSSLKGDLNAKRSDTPG